MLALLSIASATPLTNALQVHVHPQGLQFVSETLDDRTFLVGPMDLDTQISCWDIAVDNFNLDIQLGQVEVISHPNGLEVDVQVDITGNYIDVSGTSGWLDTCIDFGGLVESLSLTGGHLNGVLDADVRGGALQLSFVQTPILEGQFATDIDWFPDDLVMGYIEDLVREQAVTALQEQVPPLVAEQTDQLFWLDVLGASVGLQLSDVQADQNGLYAAASVDLGGPGGTALPLDLGPREGSHVAFGVTEPLAERVIDAGWALGLLDVTAPSQQALVDDLVGGLGLGSNVQAALSLAGQPRVFFDDAGARLQVEGLGLTVDRSGERLIDLLVDLEGTLDIGVHSGELVLEIHDTVIDIERLQADILFAEDADPDVVRNFIEGWVASAVGTFVGEVPVYSSNLEAFGFVFQVVDVASQPGGVGVWARLYDENDPAVDRVPPTAWIQADLNGSTATVSMGGDDDRTGNVEISLQIDNKGWSSWGPQGDQVFELEPGTHRFELRARDSWNNVSDTVTTTVDVAAQPDPEDSRGGCSTVPGGLSAGWFVLVLAAAGRRRRR